MDSKESQQEQANQQHHQHYLHQQHHQHHHHHQQQQQQQQQKPPLPPPPPPATTNISNKSPMKQDQQQQATLSSSTTSPIPLTPPISTTSSLSSPEDDNGTKKNKTVSSTVIALPSSSSSTISNNNKNNLNNENDNDATRSTSETSNSICLKLCLYGGKEAIVERSYNKNTPLEDIEKDMRKLFRIDDDRKSKLFFPNFDGKIENKSLADFNVKDGDAFTLEVIKSDGTWLSSKPRFGQVSTRSSKATPGLCGLSNMGNTCFMNSALQCLSNTPPLTDYILTDKFVDDINTNNPLGMHGEIARTYAELIKVMWSGSHGSFLPREFKCAVSRFAPQFNGFAQQDCQELMAFLLDGLHEDLNRIRDKPYIEVKNETEKRPDEELAAESWANYKRRNDSIVVDTFHAMLKSTLVCPGCQLVSVTFDPFCYLSLPLPVKREKQINLTFISAPKKLDESKIHPSVKENLDQEQINTILEYGGSISSFNGFIEKMAGYGDSPENRPKSCKLQVPRSGPVGEIFELVARIINEDLAINSDRSKVDPNNLVFAEITPESRLTKVYESNEHYSQLGDDCVIIEKSNKYVVPLYIRQGSPDEWNPIAIGRASFLHVPDLKYETLYKTILASLSNLTGSILLDEDVNTTEDSSPMIYENWFKIGDPNKSSRASNVQHGDELDKMECDDDNNVENNDGNENTNGKNSNLANASEVSSGLTTNSDGDEPMTNLTSNGHNNDNNIDEDDDVNNDTENKAPGEQHLNNINGTVNKSDNLIGKVSTSGNAFLIHVVNSFGGMRIKVFGEDVTEAQYSSRLYLGATFDSVVIKMPQFAHFRISRFCDNVLKNFTPKVTPKPTLQLKDCITQFANVERLGADDPWYCPKCKKHQQATKKFDIWSLPKVLIIHLKRFSYSRSWRDKIDTLVEFPVDNLDMSKYVHNPSQREQSKLVYNLIGVANHFGGLGGGHYTAYAKNHQTNNWYSFDDALVNQVSPGNVVTRSAYVLFYQLQEDN